MKPSLKKILTLMSILYVATASAVAPPNSTEQNIKFNVQVCITGGWHDLSGGGEYSISAYVSDKDSKSVNSRKTLQLFQFGKVWPVSNTVPLALNEKSCFDSQIDISKENLANAQFGVVVFERDGATGDNSKYDDFIVSLDHSLGNFEVSTSCSGSKLTVKMEGPR